MISSRIDNSILSAFIYEVDLKSYFLVTLPTYPSIFSSNTNRQNLTAESAQRQSVGYERCNHQHDSRNSGYWRSPLNQFDTSVI